MIMSPHDTDRTAHLVERIAAYRSVSQRIAAYRSVSLALHLHASQRVVPLGPFEEHPPQRQHAVRLIRCYQPFSAGVSLRLRQRQVGGVSTMPLWPILIISLEEAAKADRSRGVRVCLICPQRFGWIDPQGAPCWDVRCDERNRCDE